MSGLSNDRCRFHDDPRRSCADREWYLSADGANDVIRFALMGFTFGPYSIRSGPRA